nr:uncharacterized protein LOC128690997 [Cherax quadricarinatus]
MSAWSLAVSSMEDTVMQIRVSSAKEDTVLWLTSLSMSDMRMKNKMRWFMMLAMMYVLLAALMGQVAGELAAPERSYKILMLLPVSTTSHKNFFMPLAEALGDRGHKYSGYHLEKTRPGHHRQTFKKKRRNHHKVGAFYFVTSHYFV